MNERAVWGSVRDALLAILRHRRTVGWVYTGILLIAAASIFIIPPRYRAASKVLITSNRAQLSTSPERTTELTRTNQIGESELNSQLEILRGRSLLESVLTDIHREEKPAEAPNRFVAATRAVLGAPMSWTRAAYRRLHKLDFDGGAPLYWHVRNVQDGLEVNAVRNSNVIEIAFRSADPEWAQEFVDRLTNAYVERHAKMQRATEAEGFFTGQSEILHQKLIESEGALRKRREEIGTLAGQQQEVHDRLVEFDGELARTKVARAQQEDLVGYLDRVRSSTGPGGGGRVASPELLALEAKRAELLGRYRPDSERVRDIDEQIKRLRAAIDSYASVTPAAGTVGATTDLNSARGMLESLKGKEAALARQRDEYRKQAEFLDTQTFDLSRLERQVKLDEEAYLSYVRTAEQSRLANAIEDSKMMRLAIFEPAVVPLEPVSPNKGRILLFAIVGGALVSLGAGYALDYFEGTVKTAGDVQRIAKLEVLAVLPDRG